MAEWPKALCALPDHLMQMLPYEFKNTDLLEEALTHRSFSPSSQTGSTNNNERLEFLGDAVLGLIVSERVACIFPNFSEGKLSKVRASLISRTTLAKVAKRLDLGRWLRLGKGEEVTRGREKSSLLADALEAVIGAVYLDGGLGAVRAFIDCILVQEFSNLQNGEARSFFGDSKSQLQEWSHKHIGSVPRYELIQESGPDHQKIFEVVVHVGKTPMGRGTGRTKKEAEQRAAEMALHQVSVLQVSDNQ